MSDEKIKEIKSILIVKFLILVLSLTWIHYSDKFYGFCFRFRYKLEEKKSYLRELTSDEKNWKDGEYSNSDILNPGTWVDIDSPFW